MTCTNCPPQIQKYGANPANILWTIVRGDTATIRIQFWESNETTEYDTTGWTYESTAYDPSTNTSYPLQTNAQDNYVDITALPEDTSQWGTGNNNVVADLSFDLQVTIPTDGDDTIWTPVIGNICVLGDITSGGL